MKSEFVPMSVEAQYSLMDMIELAMYLERFNGEMPWAIQRKRPYARETSLRKPHLRGTVSSTTAKALLRLGCIKQACGETFVVTETGEEYYEKHLKPKP